MRYQALILLIIIFISSYLFKNTNVVSQSNQKNFDLVQQATVVDSIKLESGPSKVKEKEEVITNVQNTIATSNSNTLFLPAVFEKDIIPKKADSNIIKEKIDPVVVERPIIEETTSTSNDLCVPIQTKNFLAQTISGASILYEKNSQNYWPIASITKLMTAIVALENINQSTVIEITPDIVKETDGYSTLQVGSLYTANDLIKLMLSISSNDAALALAKSFGKEAFIQKMNQKAKDISMSQTNFYEPSGLSYLNQSTAHDLYLLLTYIYQHYPLILDITRQKTVTVKDLSKNKKITFNNINEFAGRNDFYGGKTGFIDQSKGNLVSLFKKNGKMVFIAVLGSADRFGDTQKILSCIQ
jgi:D-alanyl-D-alanine endopeptidase (penicillin-binding protein 7)